MRSRHSQIRRMGARAANPPLTLQGTGVVIAAMVSSSFWNAPFLWL